MAGTNIDDRLIARTLRRCKGQIARPFDVSRKDEQAAMDRGFLQFIEYPSGHYNITAAGAAFLSELTE